MRPAPPLPAQLGLVLALATPLPAADARSACFDFDAPVVGPLRPPIPLLDDRDNTVFGTYPGGVAWAAGRALVRAPIESVYAKLLDHRNVKDMAKTTIVTTLLERPGYLEFHHVDVAVRVRALFFVFKLEWTEAWAYRLAEGTREAPRKIVVSYEKIAGTRHIERQCGSYVLEARDPASTDLSLYDEIKAKRRSAEETRNMHLGILRNIRGAPAQ